MDNKRLKQIISESLTKTDEGISPLSVFVNDPLMLKGIALS